MTLSSRLEVFHKDDEPKGAVIKIINSKSTCKDFFPSPQQMTICERKDYIYSWQPFIKKLKTQTLNVTPNYMHNKVTSFTRFLKAIEEEWYAKNLQILQLIV